MPLLATLGTAGGSALLSAGSNLLSNLMGSISQNSANKTNMRIAQMNNEWSEKMMQKQMDYNTQMWEKEAEYNSAPAQAERLREAGLNPALIMGGSNAGSVSSGNSVGLPSPSAAQVSPFRPDFSGIGSAIQNAYAIEGKRKVDDENARLLGAQADWYNAKALADISEAYERTKSFTLKNKFQFIQNKWADANMNADYINKIRQNQSLSVSIMNSIRQGVLMDKQIARYDEQTNAQIADLVASTALKYSQGQLNKQQLKKVIEETKGLKLSNKEKDAIFDYVVQQADAARYKGYSPWSIGADVIHGFSKRISKWFGK